MKGLSLQKLQADLDGVSYLIIDEYSVIGQKLFGWIDRQCQQGTGKSILPFGGLSLVPVGDVAKFPPITDKVLYYDKPKGDIATDGFCMHHKFVDVIKLTVNERSKSSSDNQQGFRTLIINLRDGNSTIKDWKLLLTRTPNNVEDIETFKNSSVKLSYGNEKVASDNYESLKKLGKPIATINAKHNNSTASKLPADDMGSLQPQLLIANGAN